MKLRVPDEHLKSFKNLVVNESDRRNLLQRLKDAELTLQLRDLAESIADNIELNRAEVIGYFSVLISLYRTNIELQDYTENFSDDLVETAKDVVKQDDNITGPIDFESFRNELLDAFQLNRALGITSKAFDIATGHKKLFGSSQIFSDVRPVFYEDPTQKPSAATITHNLNISYRENRVDKDFYVVLDMNDLKELEDTIKRAKLKEKVLAGMIIESKIVLLKPSGVKNYESQETTEME